MTPGTAPPNQEPLLQGSIERLRSEFAGIFGRRTIDRLIYDSMDALAGSKVTQFLPLLAERFTRDRLRSLAKVEGRSISDVPAVLFLCVHNAGRSQMAAGWLEHLAGDRVFVMSGGSEPGDDINPRAVEAMAEVGIDIRNQFPKPWTEEVVAAADVVITMGCGDACPIFPGKRYEDWEVGDPHHADMETVRGIRDDLEHRVRTLLASLQIEPLATR